MDVDAPSATTRYRSGSAAITSTAWVPMDPVEPTNATEVTSGELQQPQQVIRGRCHEQEAVDAVEYPAVAGKHAAHVLHAEVALHHRLAQVAERCSHAHDGRQPEGPADRPRMHLEDGDDEEGDDEGD